MADDQSSAKRGGDEEDEENLKWKAGDPGEYPGDFESLPGERPKYKIKHFKSPEESELTLEYLKDPKLLLMKQLKEILYNLVTDRPENVIDYFEEYVRFIIEKHEQLLEMNKMFIEPFDINVLLQELSKWYTLGEHPAEAEETEGEGQPVLKREYVFRNNVINFKDGGCGLSNFEIFGLSVAMQVLIDKHSLKNVRFWGKIFGLYKNYYVIEVDVTKEMVEVDAEERRAQKQLEKEFKKDEKQEREPKIKWEKVRKLAQYVKPPMPKSTYKPPKFAPKERLATGLNRQVYFVSNEPSGTYVRLPDVLPVEIVKARQIKQYFTGYLDKEVTTYPPFPGKEMNLLRAQIGRITAGTLVSPLGFYTFEHGEGFGGEDEMGEEEGEGGGGKLPKPLYSMNPDFEPIQFPDLIDPSMAFWVHHSLHILPQGRAKWVNPNKEKRKMGEDGEFIGPKIEKPIPEVGPPLLTSASDDMSIETTPPWATRLAIDLSPVAGPILVKSNLWPGSFAYAFHNENNFDNIYLGWGFKHNANSFTPNIYFIPQNECEIGPEIMEITDPNPEEEDYEGILYYKMLEDEKAAKKAAKLEKQAGGPTDYD